MNHKENIPVILFCVLLFSGLAIFESCEGVTGLGVGRTTGPFLNASGNAEAGTSCQLNLCVPGRGFSFAKSKPHLWLSSSNCLASSLSTNRLFSSLSVQPKRFRRTPFKVVTPLTLKDRESSIVVCIPGALMLNVDISQSNPPTKVRTHASATIRPIT